MSAKFVPELGVSVPSEDGNTPPDIEFAAPVTSSDDLGQRNIVGRHLAADDSSGQRTGDRGVLFKGFTNHPYGSNHAPV